MEQLSRLAEDLFQVFERAFAQVAAREDAHIVHAFGRLGPHAPQLFDAQSGDVLYREIDD